jgi:hypothetical protein
MSPAITQILAQQALQERLGQLEFRERLVRLVHQAQLLYRVHQDLRLHPQLILQRIPQPLERVGNLVQWAKVVQEAHLEPVRHPDLHHSNLERNLIGEIAADSIVRGDYLF